MHSLHTNSCHISNNVHLVIIYPWVGYIIHMYISPPASNRPESQLLSYLALHLSGRCSLASCTHLRGKLRDDSSDLIFFLPCFLLKKSKNFVPFCRARTALPPFLFFLLAGCSRSCSSLWLQITNHVHLYELQSTPSLYSLLLCYVSCMCAEIGKKWGLCLKRKLKKKTSA